MDWPLPVMKVGKFGPWYISLFSLNNLARLFPTWLLSVFPRVVCLPFKSANMYVGVLDDAGLRSLGMVSQVVLEAGML